MFAIWTDDLGVIHVGCGRWWRTMVAISWAIIPPGPDRRWLEPEQPDEVPRGATCKWTDKKSVSRWWGAQRPWVADAEEAAHVL